MFMQVSKIGFAVLGMIGILTLSGCTNWEKKYKSLEVEHENLKGRYANCVGALDSSKAEKGQLASQLQQYEMTITELQKQIEEQQSAAKASGFGDKYDVDFDPAKGTLTVTLPDAILFMPGKATLKGATNADLDHIVNVLHSKYQGRQIDIIGHTDSDPIRKSKWADNWELSSERALTVLRYLNSHGVQAEFLRGVACGSSKPVSSNSSATGKTKNRRVEIVVHMK